MSLLINLLGWIGNVFLLWGVYDIGNKLRRAHLITIVGEVCWIIKSLYYGQYDLALMCVFFTALAWRCWIKWKS